MVKIELNEIAKKICEAHDRGENVNFLIALMKQILRDGHIEIPY